MLLHILEEGNSALQLPAVDGLGGLVGVLEGDSEVGTAGAGRLGGLDLGRSVSDLFEGEEEEQSVHVNHKNAVTWCFLHKGSRKGVPWAKRMQQRHSPSGRHDNPPHSFSQFSFNRPRQGVAALTISTALGVLSVSMDVGSRAEVENFRTFALNH